MSWKIQYLKPHGKEKNGKPCLLPIYSRVPEARKKVKSSAVRARMLEIIPVNNDLRPQRLFCRNNTVMPFVH